MSTPALVATASPSIAGYGTGGIDIGHAGVGIAHGIGFDGLPIILGSVWLLASARKVGNLQPEAERRESLHQDLALVGRDGRDVHRPLGEDERERLVRVGRLAFLPQYRRAGVHGVERVRTPSVPDLRAGAKVELRRTLGAGRFPEGGLPAERSAVGVHVKDAKTRLAPARSAVLDDRDARPQAGHEAPDDEVRRVGAARRWLEGGQVHRHAYLVRLRRRGQRGGARHTGGVVVFRTADHPPGHRWFLPLDLVRAAILVMNGRCRRLSVVIIVATVVIR